MVKLLPEWWLYKKRFAHACGRGGESQETEGSLSFRAVTIISICSNIAIPHSAIQFNTLQHTNIFCGDYWRLPEITGDYWRPQAFNIAYCSVLRILYEPELDHWNVSVDKLSTRRPHASHASHAAGWS